MKQPEEFSLVAFIRKTIIYGLGVFVLLLLIYWVLGGEGCWYNPFYGR